MLLRLILKVTVQSVPQQQPEPGRTISRLQCLPQGTLAQRIVLPSMSAASSLTPQLLPDSVAVQILAKQKRRRIVDFQTRDIVLNVLKTCQAEYMKCRMELPLACIRSRAAMYTGVSESTIRSIKVEAQKRKEIGQGKQPLLKVRRKRACKTVLDDRDVITIKNLIRDEYITNCRVPSVKKLFPRILNEIWTFGNTASFMHRVLPDIGYRRKKHYSKRPVLVEDPAIVALRETYLNTMIELRNKTNSVFYIYECIIDRSLTLHKAWAQKYTCNDALHDQNTFTFLCAASKEGFLKTCALLRRTDIDKNIWHCGRLSQEVFEMWLKDFLIPDLPEHSVVIMEDAPHHCVLKHKPISHPATKEDMTEYLRKMNIACDESMRRSQLHKLIEKNTPKRKVYIVDDILEASGHKGMRLPPFMIDLSPVQYAMDSIQQKIFEDDYNVQFNAKNVSEILEMLMRSITQEEWRKFYENVAVLEDDYWKKDGEFDMVIDKVLLNLRDCVDSGSDESDFDSDSENSDKQE